VILAALVLAACAPSRPELPHATGAWIHLNPDKWDEDQNDITTAPPESGVVGRP
jgi:hypothetical protein